MIVLITGRPRQGKSLYSLHLMRTEFFGRKIYASNYRKANYSAMGAEPFDPMHWDECEPGSVLFIDEVWEYFEARAPQKLPSDVIKKLAKHGHEGYDLVLITQGVYQIDKFVRALVERHIHVKRVLSKNRAIIHEYDGVCERPESRYTKRDRISTKTWRYDPALYSLFESSSEHNFKKTTPFKLYGALAFIAAFVLAVVYLIYHFFFSEFEEDVDVVDARVDQSFQSPVIYEDFLSERTEAVAGLPWSTPFYQAVIEPVTFPKPRCILMSVKERCICLSQQGTRMHLDYSQCSFYAVNGFFDPTIEDLDSDRYMDFDVQYERDFIPSDYSSNSISGVVESDTTLPYLLERLRNDRLEAGRSSISN